MMPPVLYAHPFSSYCQKVLVALYENGTAFEYRSLDDDGTAMRELAAHWPMRRFPLLVDDGHVVIEASCIIEHLDIHHPGPAPMLLDRSATRTRGSHRAFRRLEDAEVARLLATPN